jgi:hypothetical protein
MVVILPHYLLNFRDICSIRTSHIAGKTPNRTGSASLKSPKTQVFYAVVLHDFVAERADELDARAGDPISVVAQSNRECQLADLVGQASYRSLSSKYEIQHLICPSRMLRH